MRITSAGVVIGVLAVGLTGCEDTLTVDPAAPPTTDVPIYAPPPHDGGAPAVDAAAADSTPADGAAVDAGADAAPP